MIACYGIFNLQRDLHATLWVLRTFHLAEYGKVIKESEADYLRLPGWSKWILIILKSEIEGQT